MAPFADQRTAPHHIVDHEQQMRIAADQLFIFGDDPVDIAIGHPLIAADDRRIDLCAAHRAVHPYIHLRRDREAVLMRIQGTDAVAEHLRQHRHHPVCHIHAGPAPIRLFVQRRARPHIIRDIGDMHP